MASSICFTKGLASASLKQVFLRAVSCRFRPAMAGVRIEVRLRPARKPDELLNEKAGYY